LAIEHMFDRGAGRGKHPATGHRRHDRSAGDQEADVSAAAPTIRAAVPARPRQGSARALLEQARQGLVDAECASDPADRYVGAHLVALRAAAAVLAARARPRARSRPTSAWTLLAGVAPELAEWAAFFAAGSATRIAAQAGVTRLVTTRDADDLVRQVGQFLVLVERAIRGTDR
jgi:hypothetical protein